MDLTQINWQSTKGEILRNNPTAIKTNDAIVLLTSLDNIECELFLKFGANGKLKSVVIVPARRGRNATPGSEMTEFMNTYRMLKAEFGEPGSIKGGNIRNIADLAKIKDIIELDPDDLPKMEWKTKYGRIVHKFDDQTGIVPKTLIVAG